MENSLLANFERDYMDPQIITILMGGIASIIMNLGKGIQKMKVEVFKKGKQMFQPPYRRDFIIWCIGMAMTAGAGLLFKAALETVQPSIVSSLNGIGLISLAFFSMFVLKEKVGLREWSAVGLIVAGTIVVQYNAKMGESTNTFTLQTLLYVIGVCFAIFIVASAAVIILKKGQAFVFSAIAGTFLGLMYIFFKAAPPTTEELPFIMTLLTPYFIFGFFMGNGAFFMTNVAFFYGTGIVIVPTVNTFLIISPMVMEFFVFKSSLTIIQYIGVAIIVAGVILLTTGPGQQVKSDSEEKTPEPAPAG